MILSTICTLKNGKGLKISNQGNYDVVGSTGIIGKTDKYLVNTPCVVIARVGANCGHVQFIKKPSWVTDNAIIATCDSLTHTRYIFYFLSSQDINQMRIGSSQPLITSTILNNLELPVHSNQDIQHIVDNML